MILTLLKAYRVFSESITGREVREGRPRRLETLTLAVGEEAVLVAEEVVLLLRIRVAAVVIEIRRVHLRVRTPVKVREIREVIRKVTGQVDMLTKQLLGGPGRPQRRLLPLFRNRL